MSNEPENNITPEHEESFQDILSQFEKSHSRKTEDGSRQIEGTVVAITDENVILDIGFKSEGLLPLSVFSDAKQEPPTVGEKLPVSVKGRDPEGYYQLSRVKIVQPTDWSALEAAFANKSNIVGVVTGVIKGGISVDVGVRAFMPGSRTGTRDAAELEKLVGTEIVCRIIKLDVADENVVVDHRVIADELERAARERRYSELKEGETVRGTVRSLTDYGAFVDIGGVDALLHIADISWTRINKASDVLGVGQELEARILKIDIEKRRISLGLKQLQAHPWEAVPQKFKSGDRVRGKVSRIADFGAFVELEPGVEGLVHISEMSWDKKKRASDIVKVGEVVDAVILGVNVEERRISLGLKQALGDPWAEASTRFPVGSVVAGNVTSLQKFGAFVQVAEGVEGMIHVGDIVPDKRIDHPQDVLKVGQVVKALVLEVDLERRRLKLGMKQLVPTGLDEFIAEHKVGDTMTGRISEITGDTARAELGEGVFANCKLPEQKAEVEEKTEAAPKVDLSSLGSMLQARWKGTAPAGNAASKNEAPKAGQVRSFKITKLDAEKKQIEVELA